MLSFLEAKTKLWSWSGVFTLEKCEVKIGSLSNHTSYQHILHKRACRTYKTVLGKSFRWKMEASSLKRWSQKKIDLLPLILRKWTLKSSTLPFTLLTKFFFFLFTTKWLFWKLHVSPVASFFTLEHPKQAPSTEKREVQKESKKHKKITNYRFHCNCINKM